MKAPSSDQIAKAKLKIEQAKNRLAALEAKAGQETRKLDARRKIILGGLLIDAAGKDERFNRVVVTLMQRMNRDQDRKAFEGWATPSPSLPPESAASSVPSTANE